MKFALFLYLSYIDTNYTRFEFGSKRVGTILQEVNSVFSPMVNYTPNVGGIENDIRDTDRSSLFTRFRVQLRS